MTPLRAVIGVAGLALLGLILWAVFYLADLHGTLFDQAGVIVSLPWGVVTLADLYIGFVLFAVLVFLTERSWLLALAWAAPIFVLGNVWSAAWFAWRLPTLARRLARPDDPPSSAG
jgi:hypothetical protein